MVGNNIPQVSHHFLNAHITKYRQEHTRKSKEHLKELEMLNKDCQEA